MPASTAGWSNWLSLRFGVVLTVGAVLASIAFVIGLIAIAPNVEKLVDLGGQIAAGGGTPTAELGAEMGRTQKALEAASKIDLVLLILAVGAMATARYW